MSETDDHGRLETSVGITSLPAVLLADQLSNPSPEVKRLFDLLERIDK